LPALLVLGHERGDDFDDLFLLTARQARHLIKHFLHLAGRAALARGSDGHGTKRHDYLPFGEDIFAGTGSRTTTQGFQTSPNPNDGVRQKFTLKERDNETGLDYFLARYYSSAQGRFASPDEFPGGAVEVFAAISSDNPTFYADLTNPQTLSKYQYCVNNPLRYTDPSGHQGQGEGSALTQWIGSLIRRILAQKDTANAYDQERRGPLSPDKDRVVESANDAIGQRAEFYKNAIQASGLDFGALGLAEKTMKEDHKGEVVAGALFIANVGTLGRGSGAIVIGEKMALRVEPAGAALGSKVYKPILREVTVNSCANFVSRAINSGKRVFDIGPAGKGIKSDFYRAEIARLRKLGFEQVQRGTLEIKGQTVQVYEWVKQAH
jgi:RHS repeat-associated protein